MKTLAIGNHLTPYLLAACGVLATGLVIESGNLVQTGDEYSSEEQAAVEQPEQSSYAAPSIAAYSEVTERPLFREGREPPPPQVRAAVTPRAVSPLRLQLEGVAITPDSSIALVRDLNGNKMLHLAKGMKHNGWELTSITNTVATFKRGEQSQELTLLKDRP